ncbi:MAG: hypothetical protein HGA31_04380 [Candidatus Moranbacteria bacterium]|nr:hypothetical protein [Candidatus Moranbacteria bacterium]
MKSKILSILFVSSVLISTSSVPGVFADKKIGNIGTPPELTREYVCFLESAKKAETGRDSAFSRTNCQNDRIADMSFSDKDTESIAIPLPLPSSLPTAGPVPIRTIRPTINAPFPRSYKNVGGRLVCAKKNDHPSKSNKNKQGHMDMECCLDPDEVPNPHCYYPPDKYGKYLK